MVIHQKEFISPVVKNKTPIKKKTKRRLEVPGKKREYNNIIIGEKKNNYIEKIK